MDQVTVESMFGKTITLVRDRAGVVNAKASTTAGMLIEVATLRGALDKIDPPVENEVVSPERARSLAQERDEALSECDRLRAVIAQQNTPRPLTADDITEAGTSRFIYSVRDAGYDAVMRIPYGVLMDGMRAALTPPPSRPEGAGDIEATLFEWNQMDDNGNYAIDPEIITELSDHLARSFPVGSDS